MSGFAALAVKEAAVASGIGTSLLPGIAPSAVDGFAVGTLLSGLCFLLVMAPRRSRRSKRSARDAGWTTAPHNPMTPDLSGYGAAPGYDIPAVLIDPFADESAEVIISHPAAHEASRVPDTKTGSHRSKHRLSGSDAPERRPEVRRSTGRHAAPAVSVSSRMASKLAFHPLAVRD